MAMVTGHFGPRVQSRLRFQFRTACQAWFGRGRQGAVCGGRVVIAKRLLSPRRVWAGLICLGLMLNGHAVLAQNAQDTAVSTAASAANAGLAEATAAKHAVIMDYDTGIVLFSKNGDRAMPPASMSKIMTVLVVFDLIKQGQLALDDMATVSTDAWRRGGFAAGSSTMCLQPGEQVSIEDLLRGVIILSGNDAAITLAEYIAGSEPAFAKLMQAKADELGLTSASFANATGWPDPGQRISARDLAEIARVTLARHPDFYPIYGEPTFDFCTEAPSNRYNRNPILGTIDGVDGLKTGHTRESGYGLVASRRVGDDRRIVVYNGLTSTRARAEEGERLIRAAFSDYHVRDVVEHGQTVGQVPVLQGQASHVVGLASQTITVGYHRRDADIIRSAVFRFDQPLIAPVEAGDKIGELVVTIPGAAPRVVPVHAATSVERLDRWGRVKLGAATLVSPASNLGSEAP